MEASSTGVQSSIATLQNDQPQLDLIDTSLFDFDSFMGADLSFPQDLFNFPGMDVTGSSNA